MTKIKFTPSKVLLILTILQFLYTLALAQSWYKSPYSLSYEHEDLIFILHLMTWFIVYTIEQKCTSITIINK